MSIYRIGSSMTVPACEDFLLAIQSNDQDLTLQIPSNVTHSFAGGEASFAQAICTWAKKQTSRTFLTFAKNLDDPQVKKIPQLFSGLVSALVADLVIDKQGENIISGLKAEGVERIKLLQSLTPLEHSTGPQIQIICADHLGYPHPKLLYSINTEGQQKVRSRKEFEYVSKQILRRLVQKRFEESLPSDVVIALGTMLYEIFKNTEDHGMRDSNRNRVMYSMRGIHARFHSVLPSDLAKLAHDYQPYYRYITGLQPDPSHKQVVFLEVTVFDSGLGFAPTWLKQPLDTIMPTKELEAVRECFGSGKSTKPNDGFGQGLPHVMKALRQSNGFFRLRTGRFSLFSDFSLPLKNDGSFTLEPWSRNGSPILAPVSGALITLIIPLQRTRSGLLGESS